MADIFDPENVEEFVADRLNPDEAAQCVYRRDYMKLLELYREAKEEADFHST